MESSRADAADVASIDAIIRAAYDSVSGPAGTRDWNRLRSLFIPSARLVPTAENAGEVNLGGKPQMLDVDGFISRCAAHVANNGFFEKRLRGGRNSLGALLTLGVPTSHATTPMIRSRLCAELTAFSCFTTVLAGGS